MPEEKRMIKKYEMVLGVISLLFIAYVLTKQYGCFLVNKTETEVQWTDGSSHDNLRPSEQKEEEVSQEEEAAFRELAALFANKNLSRSEGEMRRMGLDKDERDYYKNLRENYAFEDMNNWFKILKTAGKTYQNMQNVFNEEQPQDGEDFYQSLESRFGIPAALSRDFAEQGKEKVSDWALFVMING